MKLAFVFTGVIMNTIMEKSVSTEQNIVVDYSLIRNMLRSIGTQHWSVIKAMDEYDIPTDQRDIYMETIADKFFVS